MPGKPAADNARDYRETDLIALVSQLHRQADLSPPEAWPAEKVHGRTSAERGSGTSNTSMR